MLDLKKRIGNLCLKYLVPKPPVIQEGKKLIACIGDSITYGAGVVQDHEHRTWEYFLQMLLGDEYQVLNYGMNGRTLQKEGDFPYAKEKFYKISHEIKADVYIIMLGTNDTKPYNWNYEKYKEEYKEFIATYRELEHHPEIVVMAPSRCFVDEKLGIVGYDINAEIVTNEIHDYILRYAKETNTNYVDLYPLTENHSEWFDDGVHPNETGNREIAAYIYENLKNCL